MLVIGPNGSMQIKFPDISWLNDLREAIKRQCNLLNENDETANNSLCFSLLFVCLFICCCVVGKNNEIDC